MRKPGLALLIGVPLGVTIGGFWILNAATWPAFQLLRMISPLSWMLLAIMAFGVDDRLVYLELAATVLVIGLLLGFLLDAVARG